MRMDGLYKVDLDEKLKSSEQNECAKKILESLGEEKRHKFLHVHYKGKK
jgi:iron only hydrogenase large subunit-like protein